MIDPFARPPLTPIRFEKGDTAILCEGRDECAVLGRLSVDWKLKPRIGICQDGHNVREELQQIAIQVKTQQLAMIGLVFDAEGDRDKRTTSLQRGLKGAGLPVPSAPMRLKKARIGDADVSTAFPINPHGEKTGSIESYFIPQVRASDRWQCIEKLLKCYRSQAPTKVAKEKVILRTFIAHGNGRNTGLNAAFNDQLLQWNHDSLDPMRRFLDLLRRASPVESAKGGRRREATQ